MTIDLKLLKYLILFLISPSLYAECTFNTAKYMSDLESPHSIKRIVVDVPKSAKFSRNFAKIITTRYVNIPPTLKKKFKANVTVEYGFGTCKYPATIDNLEMEKTMCNFQNMVSLFVH